MKKVIGIINLIDREKRTQVDRIKKRISIKNNIADLTDRLYGHIKLVMKFQLIDHWFQ